ncbi:SDHC, cytochrome b subunit of succinate dehydrogenase [Lentinula edodes]|nr:SDHC, cytochrome b subunit of succinate dehydrogenase [Lentinula edodes]
MLSTHALGLTPSLRRAAFSPGKARPSMQNNVMKNAIRSSTSLKPEDGTTILNKQRLQRPSRLGFCAAHVIEFVHGLPDAVKYTGKFILALPFSFHPWNGIRHMLWDSGKFLTVKGVYSTGYAVLGATTISTLVLMFQ